MSTTLITGLIVSSMPVLAFAEQGKEVIAAEASDTQEKDTQNDNGADTATEDNKANNTESDTKTEIKTEAKAEIELETKAELETDSDMEAEPEATGDVIEETNDDPQAGEMNNSEQGDSEKAEEEQPETEILPKEIPEELVEEIELATSSNAIKSTEESMEEQLLGTWAVDDYTSLKFDEDGQGSMLLPESEYAFRYVLEDDKLTLHFASSRAKDVAYTVRIYDDSMQLTGGRETINQEMILERTE